MTTRRRSSLAIALTVASLATVVSSKARADEPAPATAPSALAPLPSPSAASVAPSPPAPAVAAPPPPASVAPPPRIAPPTRVASADTSDDTGYEGPYRPPTVVAYEGGRLPRDSHIEERTRKGFVVGGIVVAASAYTISLAYALSTCGAQQNCRSGSDWLYVPIVGPFVTSAKSSTTGGAALAAFDGALQLGGIAMVVAGVLVPQKVVVSPSRTSWRVEPLHMGSGMGVGVTMTHF